MTLAKLRISNRRFFNKIKKSINRIHYVECGFCGAIKVEAIELARICHSFNNRSEDEKNDELNDYSDILYSIIESGPEFASYEEYKKWENSNDKQAYNFLDDEGFVNERGFISRMYERYDEIVVFFNFECGCFNKKMINYIDMDD